MGLHFLSFWPFRGRLLAPPPASCQKLPVCPTSLQWIYQRRARLHFAVFSILGLHFLAFWPCGPSFPCILALWAFISLHFGLVGLHFLSFWPFRGRLLGPPPQVAKNCPFAQRPYNGFISAVTGPILQFLAFWAFISLHFGLVGLHFLAFWPCGPSFPCILALWAFISLHFGLVVASLWAPPTSCQKRSVFPMSHIKNLAAPGPASFSNFWPFGPSFPFILAFWAFISLHFGLFGLHFLLFWPFGPSSCIFAFWWLACGPPPTSCQKRSVFPMSHIKNLAAAGPAPFSNFWHFGPSFPFILAFWAFISFHFGLLGLHFFSFWLFGPSFPFILAFWAFISFHFAFGG